MTPTLWSQSGNVPALVRLLKAVMAKGPDVLATANQLTQVKDILRFLQNSGKKHDVSANDLVEGLFRYLPVYGFPVHQVSQNADHDPSAALMEISNDVFIILLTKLMGKHTEAWTQGFIRALFFAFAINRSGLGPDDVIGVLDRIQPGSASRLMVLCPGLMPVSGCSVKCCKPCCPNSRRHRQKISVQ